MGTILITVPQIADSELIFDEEETRQILRFFWPTMSKTIDSAKIDNDMRRFAQSILIAAIDGSYAMGFIETLKSTFHGPGNVVRSARHMKSLVGKLVARSARHWWRHATQRDLKDVKIYDSVRLSIANALGTRIKLIQQGAALRHPIGLFHAHSGFSSIVWS